MKMMQEAQARIMKIKKDDQLDIYSNQPPLCVNLSFHPMYTHIYVRSHSNIKRNALIAAQAATYIKGDDTQTVVISKEHTSSQAH